MSFLYQQNTRSVPLGQPLVTGQKWRFSWSSVQVHITTAHESPRQCCHFVQKRWPPHPKVDPAAKHRHQLKVKRSFRNEFNRASPSSEPQLSPLPRAACRRVAEPAAGAAFQPTVTGLGWAATVVTARR